MTPREHARKAHLQFRVVYAFLAAQFIVPAISYAVRPATALGTLDAINAALGGGAIVETGRVWHMLAVGNVMTLGFMCAIMAVDLRRYYPMLPALAFLKGFSALYSLYIGAAEHVPVFFAIFALDGATTAAMLLFARRAHDALTSADGEAPSPRPVTP
jgi:hypothetical protein